MRVDAMEAALFRRLPASDCKIMRLVILIRFGYDLGE